MTNYLKREIDLNSSNVISTLDEVPYWSAPFGIKLLEHVNLKPSIKALDIGFGLGFPLTELAMRLGSSSTVYGIDPWDAAIERAQEKLSEYGIKNVELISGVAEHIPLDDSFIDLLVSNNGINNVADLTKTLQECSRVIKTGGQFVQTMNLDSTMVEFYQILEEVMLELGISESTKNIKQHIYKKRKPLNEFLSLIEANGFRVNKVVNDSFSYRFVDGTALFNHYFIQLAFLNSWKNLVPESKQDLVFAQVEERMNLFSKSKGYFELTVPFVVIDCVKVDVS